MSLLENLQKMSVDELRTFANTQGVPYRWNSKPETIIKMIVDKVANPVKTPNVKEPEITELMAKRLKDAEEASHNTVEMVEEAIAHIKAKHPAFVSSYDGDVWTFSCKGALECGNIKIPLRRIVRQAQIISRGRIAPLGHDVREWGSISEGKNAYTNTVLAG